MSFSTYTLAIDPTVPPPSSDVYDSNSDVQSSLATTQHNTFDHSLGGTGALLVGRTAKFGIPLWTLAVFDTLDDPIPANAVINKCTLHGTTNGANLTAFNGDFSFAIKDGKWNVISNGPLPLKWRGQRFYDQMCIVRNDDGTDVMVSASGTSNFGVQNKTELLAPRWPLQVGESFGVTTATSGTLDHVVFELSRTGTLSTGTNFVQVDMYFANEDDGSDDLPDIATGVLATSNTIVFNDLPAEPTRAETTFFFTGADRIFLQENRRYVAAFRGPKSASPTNYPHVRGTMVAVGGDARGPEADKLAVTNGGGVFLDATNYGVGEGLPTPTWQDNTTEKDPQAGVILSIAWPTFVFVDVPFQVEGLADALQGFVNRTDYVPGDRICLVMGPGDADIDERRNIVGRGVGPFEADRELTLQVDWRPRRVEVV